MSEPRFRQSFTRRNFLQTAGLAGAGLLVSSETALAQAESERLALGANAPREGAYIADVIRRSFAAPARVLERLRRLTTVAR